MANTSYQHVVERWVRDTWMPAAFRASFAPRKLPLRSGGHFDFDAVSPDGRIVANISTSSHRLASGKHGVGKVMKLRSDMLFLLLAECERRLVVLTEADMYAWWQGEIGRGRVPREIELVHAPIPEEMAIELRRARARASDEVRAVRR